MHARLDGGYGWAIVLAMFIVLLACIGTAKTTGVLYIYLLDEFHESYATTTTVFLSQRLAEGSTAIIFSFLAEHYGSRPVMLGGAMLLVSGTVASAFAKTISQLTITFGVVGGIGAAMLGYPAAQMLPKYFDKKLAIASAVAFCGGSVGPLIFPFIIEYSVMTYGLRGSFFILASLYMHVFISVALMRPPSFFWSTQSIVNENQNSDKPVNEKPTFKAMLMRYVSCLHHKSLLLFYFAYIMALGSIANFGSYLQAHAKDIGITDPTLLASLTSIQGFSELGSRIFIGFFLQSGVMLPYRFQQIACAVFAVVLAVYPFLGKFWMIASCSALTSVIWSCLIVAAIPTMRIIVGIELASTAFGLMCIPVMIAYVAVQLGGISRDLTGSFIPLFYSCAVSLILGVIAIEILAWREKTSFLYKHIHRNDRDIETNESERFNRDKQQEEKI